MIDIDLKRGLLHQPQATPGAHRCLYNAYNDKAEPFVWTRKRSVNAASKVAVSLSSNSRLLEDEESHRENELPEPA